MKWILLLLGVSVLSGCAAATKSLPPVAAPATPTAQAADADGLNQQANDAFKNGEYALALPLLKKVQATEAFDPQKSGATAEQIRVCEANLAIPPSPAAAEVAEENEFATSPGKRKVHPAPKPGEVLRMSIKQLGNFDYDGEKGGDVPEDVKRLSGSSIRLVGYMVPSDQADNITEFALVSKLFDDDGPQGPPPIQQTVMVDCPPGKAVAYYSDPIAAVGKLSVEEKRDDGYIVSIFEVQASSVMPAHEWFFGR